MVATRLSVGRFVRFVEFVSLFDYRIASLVNDLLGVRRLVSAVEQYEIALHTTAGSSYNPRFINWDEQYLTGRAHLCAVLFDRVSSLRFNLGLTGVDLNSFA